MFVVLCLQVPGDQFSDAGTRGGAEGNSMCPCLVDRDLGNAVLAAAQYRPQVEEGDGAEDLDMDDVTASLVWVSGTDKVQRGWRTFHFSVASLIPPTMFYKIACHSILCTESTQIFQEHQICFCNSHKTLFRHKHIRTELLEFLTNTGIVPAFVIK